MSSIATIKTPGIAGMHPFLAEFQDRHRRLIEACSTQTEVRAGEHIFHAGEPAGRFHLLQSGSVVIEMDSSGEAALLIEMLGPGDVLGWSWFFPPFVWQFSARALEPVTLQTIYGKRLREACDEDAEFGYAFVSRIADVIVRRLHATRRQLIGVSDIALRSQQEAIRLAFGRKRRSFPETVDSQR